MVLLAGTETQGNITGYRVSLRQNTTKSMHLLKKEKIFLRHKATYCQPAQELHKDARLARPSLYCISPSLAKNHEIGRHLICTNNLLFRGINSAKQKR